MKILALESTAKVASVAVCEGEKLLALYQSDSGKTQSEVLLPMAEHALDTLGLTQADIDVYAVTVGPGSFTGVRIGVATVKGLAFGRNKPCVGVSTLRSLAENLRGFRGLICPVMDARRGQVYQALFRSDGETLARVYDDRAISAEELAAELSSYQGDIYFVGDGYEVAKAAAQKAGINVRETPVLLRAENAYSTAQAAWELYQNGTYVTDAELACTYLRLPQAERERLEKENK